MSEQEKEQTTALTAPLLGSDFSGAIAEEPVKGSATAEEIRSDMVGEPRLEPVKVGHSMGVYELPTQEEPVREFVGIIVAATRRNAKFAKTLDEADEGDTNRPECFSVDGVVPSNASPDKKSSTCDTCHLNRAAKSQTAREAAWELARKQTCGNFLSLAVLLPGCSVPFHLRLSQSAFKPWSEYVQRIGTRGNFRYYEVVTKFKLEKRTKAGNTFSVPVFEQVGPLKEGHAKQAGALHQEYLQVLRQEPYSRDGDPSGEASEAVRNAKAAAKAAEGSEAAL